MSQSLPPPFPKPERLTERFRRAILTVPEAQELDETAEKLHGVKLADYALPRHNVIIEQKEITVQTEARIEKLEAEMYRLGLIYGFDPAVTEPVEIDRLITGKHDRFENNKVYLSALRFVEEDLSTANRQIRDTKDRLGMASAGGLVVVINEDAGEFSAHVIGFAIARLLRKRKSRTERRFSHINGVLLFQSRPIAGPRANVICFHSAHTIPSIDRFAYELMSRWTGGAPIEYGRLDAANNAQIVLL